METDIYKCECGGYEYLEINHDEGIFWVAITHEPRGFWRRIKSAVMMLLIGEDCTKEIVLSMEDAKDLRRFIMDKE